MKSMLQIAIVLSIGLGVSGQKPAVNASLYDNWPGLDGGREISNDGNYIYYGLVNYRLNNTGSSVKQLTNIESTKSNWKLQLPGVNSFDVRFSNDSKLAFVSKSDTLEVYTLGTKHKEIITDIKSFELKLLGNSEWLAYTQSKNDHLILRNLCGNRDKKLFVADKYLFSGKGNYLITENIIYDAKQQTSLSLINTLNWSATPIWNGGSVSNLIVSDDGNGIAFLVKEPVNGRQQNVLYYYKSGSAAAVRLTDEESLGLGDSFIINSLASFSEDGNLLFFKVEDNTPLPEINPESVRLDIWTWFDVRLQRQQLKEGILPKVYTTSININSRRISRLEHKNEKIDIADKLQGPVVLVRKSVQGAGGEANWNKALQSSTFLLNINDGTRTDLPQLNAGGYSSFFLSPDKKFIAWYNPQEKKYFSRHISSGETKVIAENIPYFGEAPLNERPHGGYQFHSFFEHFGWTADSKGILFYDIYDIWLFDIAGNKLPVNLTNGYGRKNNIRLRFTGDIQRKRIMLSQKFLLVAFNTKTKENGFFEKILDKPGDPRKLTMGSCVYHVESPGYAGGRAPAKANSANMYMVQRMSATESPNLFLTADFKSFKRVTDLHPEKTVNWYTTELHEWKQANGKIAQGLLYKPENFDARKKYPVIVHYYETKTESLNDCLKPEPSIGDLNILWYVSNGYIVFCPDIYIALGDPGGSCAESVLSGTEYISRLPFVNASKMGIQGISYGGFETNYLVANSSLFAAACTASGASNLISHQSSIGGSGESLMPMVEQGQYRMDASLWERQDMYLKNSPVLRADKVVTPLLIFHTTIDDGVPFTQSIEFFTALRRLGKKVWMLEYNDGNHGVLGKDALDFDLRLQQFFNYYLKDELPPEWMTKGRPAYLKGRDQRLGLDSAALFPNAISNWGGRKISSRDSVIEKKYHDSLAYYWGLVSKGNKKAAGEFGKYYRLYFSIDSVLHRTDFHLNNVSWYIFESVNDAATVLLAASVMKFDVEIRKTQDSETLDTYANLLYKAGKKQEAIAWQEKSVALDPESPQKLNALEKMKAGKPTWE